VLPKYQISETINTQTCAVLWGFKVENNKTGAWKKREKGLWVKQTSEKRD
jgi:hypothetical protein